MRLGEEGEHEVAPRVQVVHGEQQLAEPGLPEILGEQLDVASARARRRRGALQRRRAANQRPELAREGLQRLRRRRRRRISRHRPAGPAPAGARRPAPRHEAAEQDWSRPRPARSDGEEHAGGTMSAARRARTPRRQLASELPPPARLPSSSPSSVEQEADQADDDAASANEQQRAQQERRRARQAATTSRDAQRPPPAIERADGRPRFQTPGRSQSRRAPSTAANIAPTAPMPRPATRSILTPASCSARSTPAW